MLPSHHQPPPSVAGIGVHHALLRCRYAGGGGCGIPWWEPQEGPIWKRPPSQPPIFRRRRRARKEAARVGVWAGKAASWGSRVMPMACFVIKDNDLHVRLKHGFVCGISWYTARAAVDCSTQAFTISCHLHYSSNHVSIIDCISQWC